MFDDQALGKKPVETETGDRGMSCDLRDTYIERQSYWQEWSAQDPTLYEEEDRTSS